jgi:phosphoglycolate phosphatase-like HAD superfamily hydrolase
MKALVFDLDGTLADSTYQHVVAWHQAFASLGIALPAVQIHRRIGMDGDLLLAALDRAFSLGLEHGQRSALKAEHAARFSRLRGDVRLFDGAERVAQTLESLDVRWAIVTSGTMEDVGALLDALHADRAAAVITGEGQSASKPAAHPIARAFAKLRVDGHDAAVVGDSVWDMLASREAGSLGVGTGGYSQEELTASGAFRVYGGIAEFLTRLEEIGVQPHR